jgi:hypothetical protein
MFAPMKWNGRPINLVNNIRRKDRAVADGETELEMVRRHVREGRVSIRRQRGVIERLTLAELSVDSAKEVLATLEHSQRLHECHLVRLEARSEF